MDPEAEAERLLALALERPPEERAAFLDAACAGRPELRRELASLLPFAEDDPGFLQSPLLRPGPDPLALLMAGRARGGAGGDSRPARIGGYEIVRLLGCGGMGVVYKARRRGGPPVALKVLYPGPAPPQRLRRFAAEARLLGRLSHPGIARILEAGLQEIPGPAGAALTVPFLILELVEGERLDRYAARISPTDRLRLFALLCDAVDHAHQQGVIHRDLKPSNVLVDRTGQPKVLDFGVACACAASRSGGREPTRSTSTGQVLGSLPYMSPEQLGGDPRRVDARADVYALGVILHEMLTGRPPVDVRDLPLAEAAARVAGTEAAAELAPSLGGDLRRLLGAALARDRERRYGSAAELAREVRRHLAREPVRGFAGGSRLDPWNHARKEPSLTASRLKELLSDMALDPDLMARYFRDPEAVMESAGLDERERTALQSGNPVLLHACLFGLPAAPSGQAVWPVFPVLWPVYPAWGTAAWPGYGGGGWPPQAVPAAQPPAAPPSPAEEPAPAAPPSEVPQDREPEGSPRHPSRKKTRGAAEP